MIRAVEWNRLFSALRIFKIGFIGVPYPPIFHLSEKYVWLTCLDIFFTSGTKVICVENVFFILLFSLIYL